MRSAKTSGKIRLNTYVNSMPNCWGVGILSNHTWAQQKMVKRFDYWTRKPMKFLDWQVLPDHKPTAAQLKHWLFSAVREAFTHYELVYVALPQNTDSYKIMTKWYLDHKFKLENETTSKHGNYKIKVLSLTKDEWKKSYAL